MPILKVSTIIGGVHVESFWRQNQLVFAEPWMIDEVADEKSIKINHFGTEVPIRAFMTLGELAACPGFILVEAWDSVRKTRYDAKVMVINAERICQLRPWVVKNRIDHYVINLEIAIGKYHDFHLTDQQAKRVEGELVKPGILPYAAVAG